MVDIPMMSSVSHDRNSITDVNVTTQDIKTAQNILSINTPRHKTTVGSPRRSESGGTFMPKPGSHGASAAQNATIPPSIHNIAVPKLTRQIQKGQKIPLDPANAVQKIKVCLGWNVINPQCDIDVSAFLLGDDGKVPDDDWCVFYGQADSPDKAVHFSLSDGMDREYISVNLSKLNPSVKKIVFVLTINDAVKNKLNFSMVKDAYIRILNADDQRELVSFKMTDYYSNVISMMIGEIYLRDGSWKCNAIGNGVAKDLAGLCGLYGVQVS